MKKIFLTFCISIGFILTSCDNSQNKSELNKQNTEMVQEKQTTKKEVVKPDTIIDGKRIYNFNVNVEKNKAMTLEEIISDFEKGVNNATDCGSLIKACSTFDSRVKQLISEDNSIKLSDIEYRDDVREIRKNSEKKSLALCQTQQMR